MARYDVFRSRQPGVFLLDVQADLIEQLSTRMVVPLLPSTKAPPAVPRLHPSLEVEGRALVMATHLMSAVPRKELGEPFLNLKRHHDEIVSALDMLFQGF